MRYIVRKLNIVKIDAELERRIKNKIEFCIDNLNVQRDRLGKDLLDYPRFIVEDRKKRALGTYQPGFQEREPLISINIHYLMSDPEYVINRTVVHEVAHYCVDQIHKERGHGARWANYMGFFGIPANRTSTIKTPEAIQKTKHLYKCPCSDHHISTVKHNRIQRGLNYICNTCKCKLVKA
jgi:SprT protein